MAREDAYKDYMAGMKYKDIATKYNVSTDTVKSWKKRHGWNRKGCTPKSKKGAPQKEGAEITAKEIKSVMDNPDLNDKQRLFCLYYAKSFNATKSYQKAYGVDYETAASIGYRLLDNDGVREEIMKLKQAKYSRALLEPVDLFQKYMDIAFADITDYVCFGREEVQVMTMYGPAEIKNPNTGDKEPLMKEVNTVKFHESTQVDGSVISEVSQGKDGAKIKLLDKMKAMQWLTDHMDMATEEQRARIDNIKANTAKLKGDDLDEGKENDGFMDALDGQVEKIWQE